MGSGEQVNLLDALAELLQLPADQRDARIESLHLSAEDVSQLQTWLAHQQGAEGFLVGPPSLARDAMRLLNDSPDGRPADPVAAALSAEAPQSLVNAFAIAGDGGSVETAGVPSGVEVGTRVGRYRLLQQIGEGGFGLVFMAEQQHPVRRSVALKVLKPGVDTRQVIARFQAERQALAMMDHPNIAKVLDAGATDDGRPYFVMELVRGSPITEYCDKHQLSTRARLDLFVHVCQAVQHAHTKGIIHRDLKPSNVLVTVADDGQPVPKVIDFGIAKATAGQRLTDGTLFTEFRQLLGTPQYMSPEQAESDGLAEVDTRTDVYALGVLLYELLTGTTPFEKERLGKAAYAELRRIICDEEPPKPSTRLSSMADATLTAVAGRRQVDPRRLGVLVRGELDWIVMRAMEKDRTRRYETARGLGRDVERYLADEAVEACPPSATYRLRKLWRRHRGPLSIAASFVLLLLAGTVLSVRQAVRATRAERETGTQRDRVLVEKQRADEQRAVADSQRALAERRLAEGLLATGASQLGARDFAAARATYHEAWAQFARLGVGDAPAVSGLLNVYAACPPPLVGTDGSVDAVGGLEGHEQDVTAVLFEANGRNAISASADGTLRRWDLLTGLEVARSATADPPADYSSAALSPDGATILSGDASGRLSLWRASDLTISRVLFAEGSAIVAVAYSPDGRLALSGDSAGLLRVWDVASGRELQSIRHKENVVDSVAVSPDGRQVLTTAGGQIYLWDLHTGALVRELPVIALGRPRTTSFSPDGRSVAVGADVRLFRVYDVATGQKQWESESSPSEILCVRFSPAGDRLAVAGYDGTITLWAADGSKVLHTFATSQGAGYQLAFSPDGSRLLAGGAGGRLALWDTTGAYEVTQMPGHVNQVSGLAISPDGRFALSGSFDSSVSLWDLATGKRVRGWNQGGRWCWSVALSPDGRTVFSGWHDGSILAWDLLALRARPRLVGVHEPRSIAVSPDGQLVAAANRYGKISLWEATTGREVSNVLTRTESHNDQTGALAFAADGRTPFFGEVAGAHTAISGSGDGSMKMWSLDDGRELGRFAHPSGRGVAAVAWVPAAVERGEASAVAAGVDGLLWRWEFERPRAHRRYAAELRGAREALAVNPADAEALAAIGRWYAFRRADGQAAQLLEAARQGGANVSALTLARCYWQLGRWQQARTEFRRALRTGEAPPAYLELCLGSLERSPFGNGPALLPGRVMAVEFDHGPEGEAYEGVGAVQANTVLYRGILYSYGRWPTLGWGTSGEWFGYTVEVAADGVYDVHVRMAGGSAGGTLHVEFDGTDVTGPIGSPQDAAAGAWRTVTKRAVRLKAGRQEMRVCFDSPARAVGLAPAAETPCALDSIRVCRQGQPVPQDADEAFTGAQWIWFAEAENVLTRSAVIGHAPPGRRYLRRAFEIKDGQRVKRAELFLAVDDKCTLYVNGDTVFADVRKEWEVPKRIDLTAHLRPGRNVLAVAATNEGTGHHDANNPAGVLARLHVELEDGGTLDIVSDGQWTASEQRVSGWTVRDFDDSAWTPARPLAPVGEGPWGNLLKVPREHPQASPARRDPAVTEETHDE